MRRERSCRGKGGSWKRSGGWLYESRVEGEGGKEMRPGVAS